MLWADVILASKKHPGEVKIQWKFHIQPIFTDFFWYPYFTMFWGTVYFVHYGVLMFAQWTVFPNAVIVRWDIQNKRKGISAGIVVFYERNKTNVCSGVFERRYNAALIYGSFKSHIMPALTIAIYCSCIIHFFYLSNFMIIWKSQKVKLQSPGLIFISMIK